MEALPKIKLFRSKIKSCRSARFRNQKGLLPKTRKRNQKVQNIAAKDDGLLCIKTTKNYVSIPKF